VSHVRRFDHVGVTVADLDVVTAFFVALGLKLSEVSWVYMLTVFVVVYATTKLALPRTLLLDAIFWAAVIEVAQVDATVSV